MTGQQHTEEPQQNRKRTRYNSTNLSGRRRFEERKRTGLGRMDKRFLEHPKHSQTGTSGNGTSIMDKNRTIFNGTVKMEFEDLESLLRETDRLMAERMEENIHFRDFITHSQYINDATTTTPASHVTDVISSSLGSTATTPVTAFDGIVSPTAPQTPPMTSNETVLEKKDQNTTSASKITASVQTSTTLAPKKLETTSHATTKKNDLPHTRETTTAKADVDHGHANDNGQGHTIDKGHGHKNDKGHGHSNDKGHGHGRNDNQSNTTSATTNKGTTKTSGVTGGNRVVITDNGDILGFDPSASNFDFHEDDEVFSHGDVTSKLALRTRSKKRRLRRQCRLDYFAIPQGKQCCLSTVRCFDHLPELLDEIELFENQHTGRDHVCSHVKNSLSCMSGNLKRPECRRTAKAINAKFKPELESITQFYNPTCLGNDNGPGAGGQNAKDIGPLQMGVIGAAAGVAALLIILIIVCACWVKQRKSVRSREADARAKETAEMKKASSRYKDIGLSRKKSEIYAEIDDRSIELSRSGESMSSRPLPSAPDESVVMDKSGYLTPQTTSRSSLNEEQSSSNGGYAVLDVENGSRYNRYSSLKDGQVTSEDDDYISPEPDENSPKRRNGHMNFSGVKFQRDSSVKDARKSDEPPYHMYFVLEKETDG